MRNPSSVISGHKRCIVDGLSAVRRRRRSGRHGRAGCTGVVGGELPSDQLVDAAGHGMMNAGFDGGDGVRPTGGGVVGRQHERQEGGVIVEGRGHETAARKDGAAHEGPPG